MKKTPTVIAGFENRRGTHKLREAGKGTERDCPPEVPRKECEPANILTLAS